MDNQRAATRERVRRWRRRRQQRAQQHLIQERSSSSSSDYGPASSDSDIESPDEAVVQQGNPLCQLPESSQHESEGDDNNIIPQQPEGSPPNRQVLLMHNSSDEVEVRSDGEQGEVMDEPGGQNNQDAEEHDRFSETSSETESVRNIDRMSESEAQNQSDVAGSEVESEIESDERRESEVVTENENVSETSGDRGNDLLQQVTDDEEQVSDYENHSGDDEDQNNDNTCIYPGAPLTLSQSLLCILTFSIRHNLTGQCLNDLLQLIALHCLPNNICKKSLFTLKSYFSMIGKSTLVFHYFCSRCMAKVNSKDAVCMYCQGNQTEISYFIEIPLVSQLQAMLKRPEFYQKLQYRFLRQKKNCDNYEDLYDGSVYSEHFGDGGFLRNPNNISFSLFTDGFCPFKSSTTFSMWPLYVTINELNYVNRTKKENILLAGLWFGMKKPDPNTFLHPFHSCIQTFSTIGYNFEVPGMQGLINIKAVVLSAVCDLPAKSCFMRLKQYNGFYGCAVCTQKGERHPVGPRSSVHVYPYTNNMPLRSNNQTKELASQVVQARRDGNNIDALFGVKGPSLLQDICYDMIKGMGIDKMHGIFLNLTKLLLFLWCDPSLSQSLFSVSGLVRVIDNRIKQLRPPSTVQRILRSVEEHAGHWKASEYKQFFFYYSIPVLKGILSDVYLHHHCKVVSAVYLLSQRSIYHEQIRAASELLHSYVLDFEQLYGLRYMGMNVHQLLHLPLVVERLGPLWVYSCFCYEDLNGQLMKLVHGTRHAGMQICSAATAYLNLSYLISTLEENSASHDFCVRLLKKGTQVKISDEIDPQTFVVGNYSNVDHIPNYIFLALNSIGLVDGKCQMFYRLKRKGILFACTEYRRTVLRDSTFVSYWDNNGVSSFCRIGVFVKWSPCTPECASPCLQCPSQFICIGRPYERVPWFVHNIQPQVRLAYISKICAKPAGGDVEYVAFPVAAIESICFYSKIVDGINNVEDEYLAVPVNNLDSE